MIDKGKLFIGLTEMARLRYDYGKSLLKTTDEKQIEYTQQLIDGLNYTIDFVEKNQGKVGEDAIPIGYIDQVIEEYSHLIECYLYEDNDDYKTMLYYRNALNDLKRRWKRDRPKLHL